MLPIIFHFGRISFYSFGVFISLGAIVGAFVVWKQARLRGLVEEKVFDTFVLSLLGSIVVSRAWYVFLNFDFFRGDIGRMLLFLKYPGFSFDGALAGGIVFVILAAFSYDLSVFEILDIFSLAAAIGVVFGAFGCFLDACSGSVFPAWFGLSSVVTFGVLLWLTALLQRSVALSRFLRRPGMIFLCYLIFQGVSLLIASWRLSGNFSKLQLVIILASSLFFIVRYREIFAMIKFPAGVLSQINKYLEGRRDEIEHRLSELKKQDPYEDKSRLLDMASDDSEAHNKAGHERVAALQHQLTIALIQTRKALSKIKIGKYGICENCGKMIDTDRLSAMPMATLCLSCEKKRER